MSVVSQLGKTYAYFRWRLKPPRYLGKFMRSHFGGRGPTTRAESLRLDRNELYEGLLTRGFGTLSNTSFHLPDVDIAPLAGKAQGVPFYNALPLHWERFKPLICEVLTDSCVADVLVRYFDGKPWLWNVALNYSEASKGGAQESQLWHFDYGDVKQLHAMLYLSDVDFDCGPFTFFPAEVSEKVTRSPLEIERFSDAELQRQFGIDVADAIRLTGKRSDCFFADPGRTMHQGARCSKPRLVLFLTFTTTTPMSTGGSHTLGAAHRRDLYEYYRKVGGVAGIFREEFFL